MTAFLRLSLARQARLITRRSLVQIQPRHPISRPLDHIKGPFREAIRVSIVITKNSGLFFGQ
jgi:hypothetical protein